MNEPNKQPINAHDPNIFSIRQFGLNMMNGDFPPFVPAQQQTFHTNASQQSFSQQQQPAAAPPSQSPFALFDLSEPSFPYFYGAPVSNNTSQLNQQTTSVNNMNTEDPSAMFRNRPDNPFWNMPSSMEVEDWHAYLLPHLEKQQHKPI